MITNIVLSSSEVHYFQTLSSEKLSIVRIFFKNIYNQLLLNSEDARIALFQLHENFKSWDETEKGKKAWAPLLDSLFQYLQNKNPPSQELLGRVTALQNCLPNKSTA